MVSPGASPEIRFRHLRTPEEFHAAEEVQIAAWGMTEEHPVPGPLQRALEDNGGLILGAFAGDHLVGFCLGFLGRERGKLFHYSHMNAVRPEYRKQQLGFRLKRYQREEVLKLDLTEIRWTFDPLQSMNAFLNVRRLGALPVVYHVNYYGPMGSEVNRGLETDRLRVSWELTSPHVVERIGERYPSVEEDRARWKASQPMIDTEIGRSGNRMPTTVSEPSRTNVTIEIPFELSSVRAREPASVPVWRAATRRAFLACLDAGYRVEDFAVIPEGRERRSVYFLSNARKGAPRARIRSR